MFSNIGEKIKTFAVVCCIIGMLASFIGACVVWSQNDSFHDTIGLGLAVLIIGWLASWVGSFFTYGFGQLIVHFKNIDEKLSGTGLPNQAESKKYQLKQWLDEGLITEDEYNKQTL